MSDLLERIQFNGGLSEAVTGSDFFLWWIKLPESRTNGYLGSSLRNPARDRVIEAYLKSKALGVNGIAFMLAIRKNHLDVNQVSLRDFYQFLKFTHPHPLAVLIDMIKAVGVPVKNIGDKITNKDIEESEEAIKLMVRIKRNYEPNV